MSAGAIIIIAIAASGVLMMRFRKRWLAKINIAVTNQITSLFAGWLPGFGNVTHVGRKSGKVYRTPVNAFERRAVSSSRSHTVASPNGSRTCLRRAGANSKLGKNMK
jgi:hypothetical protein